MGEGASRFLGRRLRLRFNGERHAVDRPWRRTLLGWRAYFGFGEVPSPLKDLEKWIRRRLRCYAWPIFDSEDGIDSISRTAVYVIRTHDGVVSSEKLQRCEG